MRKLLTNIALVVSLYAACSVCMFLVLLSDLPTIAKMAILLVLYVDIGWLGAKLGHAVSGSEQA